VDGAKGNGGAVKKDNPNNNKGSSDAAFVVLGQPEYRAENEKQHENEKENGNESE
jgi:hypothetical protein